MAGAGKKTFTAGETLTASDVNSYLQDQVVMVFGGTAARSSAIPTPSEGMFAVTTDNDELDYYDGAAWVPALPVGAWQSWAPTLSNGGSTNGNGTWSAKYCKIGKTVHVVGVFTLGSTSVIGTAPEVSLPFDAAQFSYTVCPNRLSVGNNYVGQVFMQSADKIRLFVVNAAGTIALWNNVTATVPGTWTTGHQLSFSFTYEAV